MKTDSESTDATRKRPKRRRGSGNRAARQRKRADSSRGSTRAAHGDGPGLSRGRSRSSKAIRTGGAQGAQGSSGCAASETPGCPDDLGLRVGSADRTSTRERLVDAAMTLFRGRGYEGTGLAPILERAGVNSGSLYHFFAGKEQLLLAVLERYKELLHPLVFDPVLARVEDPIDRIFGVLDGYRRMLTGSGCTLGCPVAALALEMSEKSEAVRTLVAENFEAWRLGIRQCLIDARRRLPRDVDPDSLATLVLTVMEGGVLQARTHHRIEPFDSSVAQLRDYFDRLLTRRRRSIKKPEG